MSAPKRRSIKETAELRDCLELEDIRYTEVSAERLGIPHEDDPPLESDEPQINLTPQISTDGTKVKVDVSCMTENRYFRVLVSIEILYNASEPLTIPDDVMVEFLGLSTVVSVAPHIREAFQSMASRLRLPVPLMNLVQPMKLGPADQEQDKESTLENEVETSADA